MGDKSRIEWTDATWTIATGCEKVSPGCKHCYAARGWKRLSANPRLPKYFGRDFRDVRFHAEDLDAPLRWKRSRRVFLPSMGDLCHASISDAMIAATFAVMASCPQHQFQLLTKRAERLRSFMCGLHPTTAIGDCLDALGEIAPDVRRQVVPARDWPPRNVWLGVSAEDQENADARIAQLLSTPAAIRFASFEPLLDFVEIGDFLRSPSPTGKSPAIVGLDWVIAGGESGPQARPTHPAAFCQLRDRCARAGVPFLFKQWGEWQPQDRVWNPPQDEVDTGRLRRIGICLLLGPRPRMAQSATAPHAAVWMKRVGKTRAGRLLYGRVHDAFPLHTCCGEDSPR